MTVSSTAAREFGSRVRAARQRLGISQETLADLSDMHWTAVGRLERGTGNPTLAVILRIAAGLDVDPAELVTGLKGQSVARTHPADRLRAERGYGG
jgi:transcriptional regulator with XRE-family HTH domain